MHDPVLLSLKMGSLSFFYFLKSQAWDRQVKHKQYKPSCCVVYIVALCTFVGNAAIRYGLVDSNVSVTAILKLCASLQRFLDARNHKGNF
jgi:hypothetical protein